MLSQIRLKLQSLEFRNVCDLAQAIFIKSYHTSIPLACISLTHYHFLKVTNDFLFYCLCSCWFF
jgi:hypothetical protein